MVYLPPLVSVLVYLNSLTGDFVHDDVPAIVRNPDGLGTSSWRDVLWNDFWGTSMADWRSHKSYRPVTVATFRYGSADPFTRSPLPAPVYIFVGHWLAAGLSLTSLHNTRRLVNHGRGGAEIYC